MTFEEIIQSIGIKPYYLDREAGQVIYCSDNRLILPLLPDKSIDLVLTDPPYFLPAKHYGVTKPYFTKVWQRHYGDLSILQCFFDDIANKLLNTIKQTAIIYIFCDGQSYPIIYKSFYNFTKSLRPLIWDKMTSINGYGWRHQHELIIFAEMPEAQPIKTSDGDILRYRAEPIDDREHPSQKPLDLVSALIAKSSLGTNDLILDPFLGSGTTLVCAKKLGRKAIGIEIEEKYCRIAVERLRQSVMPLNS